MSSAFICGCAATMLTPDERALFAETRPWGLILFRRNIASPQCFDLLTHTVDFLLHPVCL